jgi:hypothetical protein
MQVPYFFDQVGTRVFVSGYDYSQPELHQLSYRFRHPKFIQMFALKLDKTGETPQTDIDYIAIKMGCLLRK